MVPSRRDFVSASVPALVTVLGGCNASSRPTGLPDRTPSDGEVASPSVPSDTSSSTETDTPEQTDRSQLLDGARATVDDAESIFLSWSGAEYSSVLGVTAISEVRRVDEVNRLLRDARRKLRQYLDDNPGVPGARIELNWARTLHDWVRIQRDIVRSFEYLNGALYSLFAQEFSEYGSHRETFDRWLAEGRSQLSSHREWERNADLYVGGVSETTYDAKVLQLETSLHSMAFLDSSLAAYRPVSRTLLSAVSRYADDPASVERAAFRELSEALAGLKTDVEEFCCSTEAVGRRVDDYERALAAARDGVESLGEASEAANGSNASERDDHESRARTAFESSPLLVREGSAMQRAVEDI